MPDLLMFIRSSLEFDYDHAIICPSSGSLLDSLTTCQPARCFITPLSIVCVVSFTDDFTLLFSWTQIQLPSLTAAAALGVILGDWPYQPWVKHYRSGNVR